MRELPNNATYAEYWTLVEQNALPLDENLARMRALTYDIFGIPSFSEVEPGICTDCGSAGPRVAYGQFETCRRCAVRRAKARSKASA